MGVRESTTALDKINYFTAIAGYAKRSMFDDTLFYYNKMLNDGFKLDRREFEIIIKNFCRKAHYFGAIYFLDEMKRCGFVPNEVMFEFCLHDYLNSCDLNHDVVPHVKNVLRMFEVLIGKIYSPVVRDAEILDFHVDKFFTTEIYSNALSEGRVSSNHVCCISANLAKLALIFRSRSNNFPQAIIVGQHGNNAVKEAVIEYLQFAGYRYEILGKNPGRIVNIQLLNEGNDAD